jgi:hypothetical protein
MLPLSASVLGLDSALLKAKVACPAALLLTARLAPPPVPMV